MARRCLIRLCAAALGIACLAGATPTIADDLPWRILILSATDPHQPAFVATDRATREVLTAPGAHAVEIYSESLDSFRFPGAQLEARQVALLKEKYAGRPIDAIITVATGALDFAERHREALWPDAYIVFHSVWDDALRGRTLQPRTTGISLHVDVAATANLALRLRPDTRQLVLIAGSSPIDQRLAMLARQELAPLAGRVAIDFWSARDMDAMAADIARLPPTTSVLYLTVYRDADDQVFVPNDALARLAAVSSVPVFGAFDTYLGHGMVAGWADDTAARGRQAAKLVQRVLSSSPTAALPRPATSISTCMADAHELRRFHIAEILLPEGCQIRFRDPSAWQAYRWQIVLGVAIIVSQSLLIAALLLQRSRRRRAELDMHAARFELAHAARLASMGELTASIAHEIKQPLSAILAHADTAEVLLEADAPRLAEIQQIIAKIRSDDLRANDVIARLRDLLGKRAMEVEAVDVNELIVDTLKLLDTEARRRSIILDGELAPELPSVTGDRVHLQQIVLNLVLNAMDAVAGVAPKAGRVVVRTAALPNAVEITVADNGPGLDAQIASRLFDSFVTTKPHGLGLGLSIARSIAEAHDGSIELVNGDGGGAVARVRLPVTNADAHALLQTQLETSFAKAGP